MQQYRKAAAEYWNLVLNILTFHLFQWIKYAVKSVSIHISEIYFVYLLQLPLWPWCDSLSRTTIDMENGSKLGEIV
jgi:hypothetical protein